MITQATQYLKDVLMSIGVRHIFDKPSDISRFKPATYALITVKEKGKTEYDGCKTAYFDDYGKGVRTYHIRRYSLEQGLTVQLAATSLAEAAALQKIFMEKIGTYFVDAENYRVDLEVEGVRVVQDEAIIANGAGAVELDIVFHGGIYVRKETRFITGVDTETELIQTQKKEGAKHGADTENGS